MATLAVVVSLVIGSMLDVSSLHFLHFTGKLLVVHFSVL